MPSSSPIELIKLLTELNTKRASKPPAESNAQENPAIIIKRVCLDVIFANKRIHKVKKFIKLDINSIVTEKGIIIEVNPLRKNEEIV